MTQPTCEIKVSSTSFNPLSMLNVARSPATFATKHSTILINTQALVSTSASLLQRDQGH